LNRQQEFKTKITFTKQEFFVKGFGGFAF